MNIPKNRLLVNCLNINNKPNLNNKSKKQIYESKH